MSQVDNNTITTYLKKHILVKSWIEEALNVKLGDELIAALKNGIVLCYLMVEIEPIAIPSIQEATTVEFRLKENVSFFLDACEELGIPKYLRFQPNELWGPTPNVVRVVECLYSLAKIAEMRNFSPSIKSIDTVPDSKVEMPEGKKLQDIKKMLANLGGRPGKAQKISAELMRRKLAYLVGQNVDFSQYEAGFIKFQALYRGFAARQKYKKMIRDLAYRERVAKEILSTERDYVQRLEALIKVYLNPLQDLAGSKKQILTKDQIKGIFADILTIFTFNESLLKRLEERVGDWSMHQKLGDIFVDIVAFLKVYTNYVQNFNTSLSILSTVGKRPPVAKFLRECSEDPRCKSLDLSAFLIMPIQRIPRYHLLLQDLVKHTWVQHCDYENLNEAMEKVKQVGAFLNDKKREAEGLAETFARHSWIKGKELDVTPDRRFIREDSFVEVKKSTEITIFLFSDLIVYGKPLSTVEPGKTKIKFKGQMTTIDCEISEKPPVKNHKFCFALGDLVCAAKTDDERLVYVEAVKEVKEDAASKLSSHIKARMAHVPKKGTLKKSHAMQARAVDIQPETAAVVDGASVEDVLRMRKKNQGTPAPRSPTLSRASSLISRSNSLGSDKKNAPPASRLSDDTVGKSSTSSSERGSMSSDVSDGDAERENLMKSKGDLFQKLLELPTDPAKDSKKQKKSRTQWEQELEHILRKLSEIDQHTNSPPIVADREAVKQPESGLSTRSSPTISRATLVSREETRRNFVSTNNVAVPLPLAVVARDDRRAFNSVRGYQPTNPHSTQPSPPGGLMSRGISSPQIGLSPSASPTPSPSPSPPTAGLKPTLLPKSPVKTNPSPPSPSPPELTQPPTIPPRSKSPTPSAGPNPGANGHPSPTLTRTPMQTPMPPPISTPPTTDSPAKLSFDDVQMQKATLNLTILETYLSDSEFLRIFKIPREAFYKQPKWKQEQQKKENKLI